MYSNVSKTLKKSIKTRVTLDFFLFNLQTLLKAGAVRNVPDTGFGSLLVLERTVLVFVCRDRLTIRRNVTRHVSGEQCRSRLGNKTVRQVSAVSKVRFFILI